LPASEHWWAVVERRALVSAVTPGVDVVSSSDWKVGAPAPAIRPPPLDEPFHSRFSHSLLESGAGFAEHQRKEDVMKQGAWAARTVAVLALVMMASGWPGEAKAASLAASSQASTTPPGSDDGGWMRVQQIEQGTQLIIGVSGRQPLRYTLLLADDSGMVVVKPTDKPLDEDILDAFVEIGWGWTEVLAGRPAATGGFVIRDRGVYLNGKRLMELAAVVERIDRAAITEVRGAHTESAADPSTSAGKGEALKGGIAGALIGLGAWAVAATVHASDGCGDGCYTPSVHPTAQAGLVAGGIGALIGGLVGWSHKDEHSTFYVAPKALAATHGDVPWEKLRLALPLSLQGAGAARRPETNVRPIAAPSAVAKSSPWSVAF
jgi:hypothetical protein